MSISAMEDFTSVYYGRLSLTNSCGLQENGVTLLSGGVLDEALTARESLKVKAYTNTPWSSQIPRHGENTL